MFADAKNRCGSFEHRRRLLRCVGLVALAAALLAALPATAAAAPGDATVFVQSAKSGQLGGGRLVLGGVSGRVSWATNTGRAGVLSLRRLHRRLIRPGKPAAGTLHIAGQRGGQELAFRLSRPRYNPARHTVAYRAKPLPGRRAARAAGFSRPRRFGPASLSIIPHPTLMSVSPQGNTTCSATITNNTNYALNGGPVPFERLTTDVWNPSPPSTIAAGKSATWASVGDQSCANFGVLIVGNTSAYVQVQVCIDSFTPVCDSRQPPSCTIHRIPNSDPPPAQFSCTRTSLPGDPPAWTVGQG